MMLRLRKLGKLAQKENAVQASLEVLIDLFLPPELAADWEKTSLKPYIDLLDKHVAALMAETRQVKREMGTFTMLASPVLTRSNLGYRFYSHTVFSILDTTW